MFSHKKLKKRDKRQALYLCRKPNRRQGRVAKTVGGKRWLLKFSEMRRATDA
jgi:hypothetical protein